MKTYGEWWYNSTNLDLDTRWRSVVSFMPRPLYPQYPLDRRLGGPKRRSGRFVQEKYLALPGIELGPSNP
jgi:hypothetical protein